MSWELAGMTIFRVWLTVAGLALAALCGCGDDDDTAGPGPTSAQGDRDGDGDAQGDGDGDGDAQGDGDGDGDSYRCAEGPPANCECPGPPCFGTCIEAGDVMMCADDADAGQDEDAGATCGGITCDDVCGAAGCRENRCSGTTWLYGTAADDCARAGEYGRAVAARCDEPIRFEPPGHEDRGPVAVTCCCGAPIAQE